MERERKDETRGKGRGVTHRKGQEKRTKILVTGRKEGRGKERYSEEDVYNCQMKVKEIPTTRDTRKIIWT